MNARTLLFAPVALLTLVACGDDGFARPVDIDAGEHEPDATMRLPDAGASGDAAGVDAAPPMSLPPGLRADPSRTAGEDPDSGLNADELPQTCRDGIENEDTDVADGVDCDDPQCHALGVCCVGRADCCAPVDTPPTQPNYGFVDCLDLGSCAPDAAAFGRGVEPASPGLYLRGDEGGEGGLRLGEPVDLRAHTVGMTVSFRAPRGCDASCLETMGFGAFTLADDPQPLVTVEYGAMRGAFLLSVRGRVLASQAVAGEDLTATLTLEPTGDVVFNGVRVPHAFAPSRVQLALQGRGRNPDEDEDAPLVVRSIDVDTRLCDMPEAWSARRPLIEGGTPSIARQDARTRIAWVQNEAIHVADLADDGSLSRETTLPGVEGIRYADPELTVESDGWWLYLTELSDEAGASVVRLPGDGDGFGTPEVVRTGARIAQVAHTAMGERVLFLRIDDRIEVAALGRTLEEVDLAPLLADASTPDAFAVSVVNGAWHMHVAERRGTRVSLRLFVSDELVRWRDLGEVFSGDGQGFDALGTDEPATVETPTGTQLLYAGDDGARRTLGFAHRLAPSL